MAVSPIGPRRAGAPTRASYTKEMGNGKPAAAAIEDSVEQLTEATEARQSGVDPADRPSGFAVVAPPVRRQRGRSAVTIPEIPAARVGLPRRAR